MYIRLCCPGVMTQDLWTTCVRQPTRCYRYVCVCDMCDMMTCMCTYDCDALMCDDTGPVDYMCPATNNCTIDKHRRKSCQACRLRRCYEVGMNKGEQQLPRQRQTLPTTHLVVERCSMSPWRHTPLLSLVTQDSTGYRLYL